MIYIIWKDAQLLHSLMLTGCDSEEISAVVQLHAPYNEGDGTWSWPSCQGCPGTIQGDANLWEDCPTLRTLNAWMHVDGYPTGVGQ